MSDAVVVIAYRDMGCPHRRASAAYVQDWYTRHGYPVVVEAGQSDVTFTRASAINTAIRATDAAVIVQSDPDSLIPDPDRLAAAVQRAADADGLVIPHDRYLYLSETATAAVLADRLDLAETGPGDCDEYGPDGSGNVVVFSRQTWERAGGFDERFGIRSGDDAAFRYACDSFFGPSRRLEGDVLHLYHPRLTEYEPGGDHYAAQFALLATYRDAAAKGPAAVRRLVSRLRAEAGR